MKKKLAIVLTVILSMSLLLLTLIGCGRTTEIDLSVDVNNPTEYIEVEVNVYVDREIEVIVYRDVEIEVEVEREVIVEIEREVEVEVTVNQFVILFSANGSGQINGTGLTYVVTLTEGEYLEMFPEIAPFDGKIFTGWYPVVSLPLMVDQPFAFEAQYELIPYVSPFAQFIIDFNPVFPPITDRIDRWVLANEHGFSDTDFYLWTTGHGLDLGLEGRSRITSLRDGVIGVQTTTWGYIVAENGEIMTVVRFTENPTRVSFEHNGRNIYFYAIDSLLEIVTIPTSWVTAVGWCTGWIW